MKCSHHQTTYIGKWVGLRTYQHPCKMKRPFSNLSLSHRKQLTFYLKFWKVKNPYFKFSWLYSWGFLSSAIFVTSMGKEMSTFRRKVVAKHFGVHLLLRTEPHTREWNPTLWKVHCLEFFGKKQIFQRRIISIPTLCGAAITEPHSRIYSIFHIFLTK
jgi:hypothetical protein